MTKHDQMLAQVVADCIKNLDSEGVVDRLFELGFINRRACEQEAIVREIELLEREQTPRCEAFHIVAEKFCCSYEKARGAFYSSMKKV